VIRRPGGRRGGDDVAHVGQVTLRIEVANANLRRQRSGFDQSDLPRKAGQEETGILTRPYVVKGPRDHDIQSVLPGRGQRELILCEL
jgi:hypothetical protein